MHSLPLHRFRKRKRETELFIPISFCKVGFPQGRLSINIVTNENMAQNELDAWINCHLQQVLFNQKC